MRCIFCEKELPANQGSKESNFQPENGGEVRVSFHYGSKYDYIGYQSPVLEPYSHKNHSDRSVRLAGCSHIMGVICDSCFRAKSHLFQGWNEKPDKSLEKLV